jgi:hypothetical protein
MEIGDVLTSKPVQEVVIEISPEYETICRKWLEQHGCRLEQVREGWYCVFFPGGTQQEERLGTSGLYTRRYYVVLPSKIEMPVYIASPINETQRVRITMGFPPEIFPG